MKKSRMLFPVVLYCLVLSFVPSCSGDKDVVSNVKQVSSSMLLKQVDKIDKKNIVFDLTGVLFHLSKSFVLNEIGILRLLWYSIRHFKNPFNFFDRCIDFLCEVSPPPNDPNYKFNYKGRLWPEFLNDFMIGKKTSEEILSEIEKALPVCEQNNFFVSSLERSMIETVIKNLFSPKAAVEKSLIPIDGGINVLKAFRDKVDEHGQRKHKLYLLSNFDHETFALLLEKHPTVFDLFDEKLISAQVGFSKPSPGIYESFFSKYKVAPKDCFFIDDQADNIEAAQQFGMDGVQFKK